MITLKNVSKFYYSKGVIASGFSKVNLTLNIGEFVAITGESGSGKSTLLNVISGLDSYEEGEMYIDGKETSHYTEVDFLKYRRKYISNIFQNFNLVNSYTVKENVELVLLLNGESGRDMNLKVSALIRQVGLTRYKNTKVSKLSGGQKQRVAIARALARETPIIIADEPTGNLDSRSAKGIIELLSKISHDKLVVIVTHNYDQVEPYVTRKIRMHDGKILEDKVIRESNSINYVDKYVVRDISFINKLRLGIRNAFNIVPKFLLVLLVYLFITVSVTTEYAFFKKQEYETSNFGSNNFFSNITDNRLIINKKDKSEFSDEDYASIMDISHVESISQNDLLVDSEVYVTDNENFYYNSRAKSIKDFKGKIDLGKMPQADNEIIIMCQKDDWYLSGYGDKLIGMKVYLDTDYTTTQINLYKIVGVSYVNNELDGGYVYGSDKMMNDLQFSINAGHSDIEILFNGNYHVSNDYDMDYRIIPTNKVNKGEVYVTEDWNNECNKNNCVNEKMNIKITNLYYNKQIELKVTKLYNSKNMNSLLGEKDFNAFNGAIYISSDDYALLFNSGNYQSSVYVDDVKYVDSVSDILNEDGINVLRAKDILENSEVVAILKIIRTVVTIVLLVSLFFISYFVIRIILKSRNIYYGTIRILGATKKCCKELLNIELLTVSNIAYFAFLILLYLHSNNVIKIGFLNTLIKYLGFGDYLILYIIITLMSYLISVRFARKIFKDSAISTIREGE